MCDLIGVKLRQVVAVDSMIGNRITIVGTFEIKPEIADGEFHLLYRLNEAVVRRTE